jgi:hypothetical protein
MTQIDSSKRSKHFVVHGRFRRAAQLRIKVGGRYDVSGCGGDKSQAGRATDSTGGSTANHVTPNSRNLLGFERAREAIVNRRQLPAPRHETDSIECSSGRSIQDRRRFYCSIPRQFRPQLITSASGGF